MFNYWIACVQCRHNCEPKLGSVRPGEEFNLSKVLPGVDFCIFKWQIKKTKKTDNSGGDTANQGWPGTKVEDAIAQTLYVFIVVCFDSVFHVNFVVVNPAYVVY